MTLQMTHSRIVTRYRKHRSDGLPASHAWSWANEEIRRQDNEPDGFNIDGKPFDVDGWEIKIKIEVDDWSDYEFLGKFTDQYEDGALDVKQSGGYRYFVPTSTERDHFMYLNGKGGMAKSVAHDLAHEYVQRDYRAAREYCSYYVQATASKNGIVLGRDSLGGCDYDNMEDAVWDHGLIENAIADAKNNLSALISPLVAR